MKNEWGLSTVMKMKNANPHAEKEMHFEMEINGKLPTVNKT